MMSTSATSIRSRIAYDALTLVIADETGVPALQAIRQAAHPMPIDGPSTGQSPYRNAVATNKKMRGRGTAPVCVCVWQGRDADRGAGAEPPLGCRPRTRAQSVSPTLGLGLLGRFH